MEPKDLPVYGAREHILAALRDHRAVVVEGPTGCGKTTQIPQMLRDSDLLAAEQLVGVTQPRRIAAVGVAHRMAAERGCQLGAEVGYAIRFDDQTSPATRIKVMTDGILLQEARTDPDFACYGVVMVDEAHERSLNIDFTLGLLREAMDRRTDLRVVVSSATIDPGVFARFLGGAPRVAIDARPFPVRIVWRPPGDDTPFGRMEEVCNVVEDLHRREGEGDVLVFLTGEEEIKRTLLDLQARRLRDAVLLPLYGRLQREDQERVFDAFPGRRKIVLATNIAETSITIDGVRFVVDTGVAKVPGYDTRTGIPSLREQPVSQASAHQRAGRAGRTAPGTCIRLYGHRDFHRREAFQTEEVLRMDLSEVVLRMIDLGIRRVEHFPFVTRPTARALTAAVGVLEELSALDRDRHLTHVGQRMVPFPLPPRLARMIVACADESPDVLEEVLTVCALLSVRWPMLIPPGEDEAARAAHRRFAHPLGDLVGGVCMVRDFEAARDRAGFCERGYLDVSLMDEVLRIRDQLREIADKAGGISGGRGGDLSALVRAVAAAFPGGVCRKIRGGFETATGVHVAIHPGSCLRARPPRFCVAADIVVTHRAWARAVSVLEPGDIAHLFPGLARTWGIRANRGRRAQAPAREPAPSAVTLGGQVLAVRFRGGRPTVDIEWRLLRALSEGGAPEGGRAEDGGAEDHGADAGGARGGTEVPRVRVRVLSGEDRFLEGLHLGQALAVAPLLRIDEPEVPSWPESEVLDAEREIHRIMRFALQLLRVVRSRRRPRAAFLAMLANGAGGFWFDAVRDLALATEQSLFSVGALMRERVVDESDLAALEPVQERLESIRAALSELG